MDLCPGMLLSDLTAVIMWPGDNTEHCEHEAAVPPCGREDGCQGGGQTEDQSAGSQVWLLMQPANFTSPMLAESYSGLTVDMKGRLRTDACVGIRRSSMMGLLRWWMGHSLIVCDDAFLKLSENHREAAGMMTWRCRRASDRVWASS